MNARFRERIKELLGPRLTVQLRCVARGLDLPRWGNLRRTAPFSEYFGFDRGTPVDRYYLRRFLDANRGWITGDCLEIQSPGHTLRHGSGVRMAHSVDINPTHGSTYVCDLAKSDGIIPSERYDAFLLPNTLSFLRDLDGCLAQALRVVRPGGMILGSTAVFVPLIPDGPDYWHLSADGWREVAARVWPGCEVVVESWGNCLAATAAMLGLALEELTAEELDVRDGRYPVLVTVACRKPAG